MMNTTVGFILSAILLLLIVLVILLRPLLRSSRTTTFSPRQTRLAILRDQLRELERERDEGALSDSEFNLARQELQRRLLEEIETEANPVALPSPGNGKKTALALLLLLPLVAAGGYLLLGTPQALDLPRIQAQAPQHEIDVMLQRLVDRLKDNPDDMQGWVMLARSYKTLGRFAQAAEAYSHAGPLVNQHASLLADYAEVLASANGRSFDGKPDELIAQALVLDPDEPQALFLAGSAAMDRKNLMAVVDYWGRLLLQLEPGSEEAKALEAVVNKARETVDYSPEIP